MEPGRELDALIAEKVMGLVEFATYAGKAKASMGWGKNGDDWKNLRSLPNYSTDISAAWEVVEKYFGTVGHTTIGNMANEGYYCELFNGKEFVRASSVESAPHAICLAALKVIETT